MGIEVSSSERCLLGRPLPTPACKVPGPISPCLFRVLLPFSGRATQRVFGGPGQNLKLKGPPPKKNDYGDKRGPRWRTNPPRTLCSSDSCPAGLVPAPHAKSCHPAHGVTASLRSGLADPLSSRGMAGPNLSGTVILCAGHTATRSCPIG